MNRHRLLSSIAGAMLLVAAGCVATRAAAQVQTEAAPARYDAALVAQGRALALMGNCASCHTARGAPSFAGGRALTSAFGTLYSTNITPDPDTGIGRWSFAEFARAMREGVDREGRNLYPAFPYEHFTHLTDDDLRALYAYFMTREPVRARPPPNRLNFPANSRSLIGVWKALYLRHDPVPHDATRSAEWNRGAYLVQALAHCGACHTPRNFLQGEKSDRPFAGGETEGWYAPALNAQSPAPTPWSREQLVSYLRRGVDDAHDAGAGPMIAVVHNLAQAPEADVQAIATYIASLAGRAGEDRIPPRSKSGLPPQGAAIYAGACAHCHDRGRRAQAESGLALEHSTAVAAPTPGNLIRVVRDGIVPAEGNAGPWMPAFGAALTDAQMVALTEYLRARYTDRPPWNDVEEEVRKVAAAGERE